MTPKPQSTSSDTTHEPAPTAAPIDRSPELPLAIGHTQMNAAYDKGEVVPLGTSMAWLVRYLDAWWVVYERGWLRVTDTATAEDLDQAAARLTRAETIAESATAPPEVKADITHADGARKRSLDHAKEARQAGDDELTRSPEVLTQIMEADRERL